MQVRHHRSIGRQIRTRARDARRRTEAEGAKFVQGKLE